MKYIPVDKKKKRIKKNRKHVSILSLYGVQVQVRKVNNFVGGAGGEGGRERVTSITNVIEARGDCRVCNTKASKIHSSRN
jgi:hypothetical protein